MAAWAWYGAQPVPRQRTLEEVDALGDQLGAPAGPVLLREGDQSPVSVGARVPAGVVQQHQREQTGHLRLIPAALADQLDSCRVSRIASATRSTSPV